MIANILCISIVIASFIALADAGVTNPFSKTSRIVIVGAGPAGIHMASSLTKLGYTNITILERTHRVSGKSYTLYHDINTGQECVQPKDPNTGFVATDQCIAHEMGTCFLHNGYHTIRDLIDEYGLTPEVSPEGRAMFSHFAASQWDSQKLGDFVVSSIQEQIKKGAIQLPWWLPSFSETMTTIWALTDAVERYNDLHKSIFGEFNYTMPDRLSAANLGLINLSFADFLTENNLQAISGFLMFAHAAQGYGYVKSIPAYYGLIWISPELLHGYVQSSLHQKIEEITHLSTNNPLMKAFIQKVVDALVSGDDAEEVYRTTTMLPEGYAKIWKTMYETHALNVLFGVTIAPGGISRSNNQVTVHFSQDGGAPSARTFDFLIYTAAFADSKNYVGDLTAQETQLFAQLSAYVLSTTLYTGDQVYGYTDDTDVAIMYNADKMDNSTQDGGWYADRDDPRIFGEYKSATNQMRVGYQFFENPCAFDSVLCNTDRSPDPDFPQQAPNVLAKLQTEFATQKLTGVKIMRQFAFPYFHHFNQKAIQSGAPWDLVDMQGLTNTWWLGASASFESVHDVTNYNNMILAKYLGVKGMVGDKERDRAMFGKAMEKYSVPLE